MGLSERTGLNEAMHSLVFQKFVIAGLIGAVANAVAELLLSLNADLVFTGTVAQMSLPGASLFAAFGAATELTARDWFQELGAFRLGAIVTALAEELTWPALFGDDTDMDAVFDVLEAVPAARSSALKCLTKAVAVFCDDAVTNSVSVVVDRGGSLF